MRLWQVGLVCIVSMPQAALGWELRGAEAAPVGVEVAGASVLTQVRPDWSGLAVAGDLAALGAVAADAARWLRETDDPRTATDGLLGECGVDRAAVLATLDRVAAVAREDAGKPAQRLADPAFLAEEFVALAWRRPAGMQADRAAKAGLRDGDGKIRLTRYLIWQVQGSSSRAGEFTHALYGPPADEVGWSEAEAEARKGELDRFRFTRRAVLDGAFEPGGQAEGRATPLVWLRREDVLGAMMQGTVEVALPDGSRRYNVARANGMPYRPGVGSEYQERYWYFREVDAVLGYGPTAEERVRLQPGVSVAGDVYNLGVGPLFALRGPGALRLAVLADTGGAFQPNLFQLDLYAGAHATKGGYMEATADMPARVDAVVLVSRAAATDLVCASAPP